MTSLNFSSLTWKSRSGQQGASNESVQRERLSGETGNGCDSLTSDYNQMKSESATRSGSTTAKAGVTKMVLDGGIGGNVPSSTGYFLNSKYIFFRPMAARNFVPIGDERMSTNQDAIVRLIGWAGNMTASGLQFQGLLTE